MCTLTNFTQSLQKRKTAICMHEKTFHTGKIPIRKPVIKNMQVAITVLRPKIQNCQAILFTLRFIVTYNLRVTNWKQVFTKILHFLSSFTVLTQNTDARRSPYQ